MRISALARVAAALTTAALTTTLLGLGAANADEPALPVAVDDSVTLYPGQSDVIDVLANDSAPSGDDLALCRFPEYDFLSAQKSPGVLVTHSSTLLDGTSAPGAVMVAAMPRARGIHVVDYYVCDHTHLVPAKLTVVVREVAPVDVRKVAGKPGRLRVTNHNDRAVRLWYGGTRGEHPDGRVRIPAGATRTIRVQRHVILWAALIGTGSGKSSLLASPGIADHGIVRHIKLRGRPLPAPKHGAFDSATGRYWLG